MENQFILAWPTVAGQTYQLEYKDNLSAATWISFGFLCSQGNLHYCKPTILVPLHSASSGWKSVLEQSVSLPYTSSAAIIYRHANKRY